MDGLKLRGGASILKLGIWIWIECVCVCVCAHGDCSQTVLVWLVHVEVG